jgi:hypothetical protein
MMGSLLGLPISLSGICCAPPEGGLKKRSIAGQGTEVAMLAAQKIFLYLDGSRYQPFFRSKYTKNGTPNRAVTKPTGRPAGG